MNIFLKDYFIKEMFSCVWAYDVIVCINDCNGIIR